jgi:hypothetical protein
MRQTDQYAALAHQILLRSDIPGLDAFMRSGWARFILSLMRRTPEALKALCERVTTALMQEFPQLALPGDPGGDDQRIARQSLIERQRAMVLQGTINSEWVGTHLINMRWSVVTFTGARHLILTSDRPFVMTNGMEKPGSHIVMPISPTQCFLAANTIDIERQIHRMPPKDFMQRMNHKMACQARKYVYGVDDSQLRFVSNRFGRKDAAGPGDV